MAKKLHYFNLNGLAESIRYILHYGGHQFEDVRYERSEWPIKEIKDSLPYGKMPLYEEGSRKMTQSIAIARYVAGQSGLLPADPWEQAVLDATVLTIYDWIMGCIPDIFKETDETKRAALVKKTLEETSPYFLSRFEKELKDNNGHFGGKLSWADFVLLNMVETINLYLSAEVEKDYPTIVSLFSKLRSLPGVKEYIANRPKYFTIL